MTTDRWLLFCRVVDNYGDVGIAWRIARQLAKDPRRSVGLVVDGLAALARIEPRIDADAAQQTVDGIDVIAWSSFDAHAADGPAVVVEILGCGLPATCLEAMRATDEGGPVWIDVEHLSAEAWVTDFHGRPSPHPRLPLVKHFFFPGFDPATGGLWLEADFDAKRRAFVDDEEAVAALWRRLGVPPRRSDELRVSLFAYPTAPVDALVHAMCRDRDRRWTVIVPEGIATAVLANLAATTPDGLKIHTIPFTDQDDYDRLLWSCDINFVRGEDSFVRAQAAARPMVWQIYPQSDDAHHVKLAAFADRYEKDLDAPARAAHRGWWDAWNGDPTGIDVAFGRWVEALPALRTHASRWAERLGADEPLVDRLGAFVDARRHAGLLD